MDDKPYKKLIAMAALSFICMYILMYAMVDTFSNIFTNINQFYMAGLMAMPMIIIEIALMGSMYTNKKINVATVGASCIVLIAFFLLIRQQTAVSDRQFLKSMIPHHASAILMAKEANINDPEIKELCRTIIASQQQEIDQMKAKLKELKK
ncbi:DUF305 domain-containing protein [Dyadobacter sp. MSC1_007]|jgi:uncharacterized protein (DUF305 family)|uniref:DUF305 domain-containing protein n=1 Tax=Dyadobacter sp. MSC1_007 TaxID=2909264 RepID=UPI002030F49C|nr:DUF305 domain-containing protein [Dyadobacter sp. MSC1_007]